MSKDTGFDAFFQAVTSAPEFKTVVENDWGEDFEKALKKMEETVDKASELPSKMMGSFDTPEAREVGNSLTTDPSKFSGGKTNMKEENKAGSLDIRYPKMKNPETYGFKGVAGMDELKQNLRENFIKPLKFKFMIEKLEEDIKNKAPGEDIDKKSKMYTQMYEVYKQFKVGIPTGMLFYGPPGTGKTFITKKLSEELGAGMIKKSVGEFGSSYIHQTSKNIKEFFAAAKKASEKGPIILFLDEIDSLVSKRGHNVDANKAEEVSQFLQEFNALGEAPNLIVIAATNRPDHLDSAILRSGRFDKKIYIGEPDFQARKELFKIYIEKEKRPHGELDYDELALLTEGYVAADLEAICDEVARDASKNILELAHSLDGEDVDYDKIADQLDDHIITMDLLKQAIKETVSSLKMVDMSVFEEWEKTIA